MFRFPVTGARVRNYDGLGGQLLSPTSTSTTSYAGRTTPCTSTGPRLAGHQPAVRRDREALP
ncbi:DUF6421 family protein [Streptomyces rapamycinicus]|uniref:DUF6421 family protein n=1 Tax=Streptomyces rapamycinicus TaxID=1226757 RepID=UPI0032D8DEE2